MRPAQPSPPSREKARPNHHPTTQTITPGRSLYRGFFFARRKTWGLPKPRNPHTLIPAIGQERIVVVAPTNRRCILARIEHADRFLVAPLHLVDPADRAQSRAHAPTKPRVLPVHRHASRARHCRLDREPGRLHIGIVVYQSQQRAFPWIDFAALDLGLDGPINFVLLGEVPRLAGIERLHRIGPQLIAVAQDRRQPNLAALDRPEPPRTRRIAQIAAIVWVHRADEHAAAGG